jgi:hypothetical protein
MRQTAAVCQLAQENPAPEPGAQLLKPEAPIILVQLRSFFTFLWSHSGQAMDSASLAKTIFSKQWLQFWHLNS